MYQLRSTAVLCNRYMHGMHHGVLLQNHFFLDSEKVADPVEGLIDHLSPIFFPESTKTKGQQKQFKPICKLS